MLAGIVLSQRLSSDRRQGPKQRTTEKPKPATHVAHEEDDDTTSECPEKYGFFADAEQC